MPERCPWCGEDPLYVRYHDREWGVPVYDDCRHFEFLVLESAQAGLSWITVLRKREAYRSAYRNFDPEVTASFDEKMIHAMLQDNGLIRNRLKIEASVNNARRFLEIQAQFGSFSEYLWRFVEGKPVVGAWRDLSQIPVKTPLADRVSGDLKQRGFKFMGSIIVYSHLQATGLVNDHLVSCFRFQELLQV
jgi:DNA-3-methyladenine glycosylase I